MRQRAVVSKVARFIGDRASGRLAGAESGRVPGHSGYMVKRREVTPGRPGVRLSRELSAELHLVQTGAYKGKGAQFSHFSFPSLSSSSRTKGLPCVNQGNSPGVDCPVLSSCGAAWPGRGASWVQGSCLGGRLSGLCCSMLSDHVALCAERREGTLLGRGRLRHLENSQGLNAGLLLRLWQS